MANTKRYSPHNTGHICITVREWYRIIVKYSNTIMASSTVSNNSFSIVDYTPTHGF